jgi:hypothetical protein
LLNTIAEIAIRVTSAPVFKKSIARVFRFASGLEKNWDECNEASRRRSGIK